MPIFWPAILTLGVGQFICMTFFFYSLKLTKKTGNVMIMNALNIVVAFMISYIRYHENINFFIGLGAISILISMIVIIHETQQLKKQN